MEEVDLFLDNDNSLDFNVSIESTKDVAAKCRLMIENNDISYSFAGKIGPTGEVSIVIPPMKGILKEGKYKSSLEVIVDDRIFNPLNFTANFENSVTVKVERVKRKPQNKITATASFSNRQTLTEKKKKPTVKRSNAAFERRLDAVKKKLKESNVDLSGLTEAQLRNYILNATKKK